MYDQEDSEFMKNFIDKIGVDRFAHFGLSGMLAGICKDYGMAWWGIMGIILVIGLVKELSDGYFDLMDLGVGILGGSIGLIL